MENFQGDFNYPLLVDEAMRSVVKHVLEQVDVDGLHGDHHFFISFNTQYSGVRLSPQLLEKYPEEMTIVVQHQFWDLIVEEHYFSLMLSFNNIPEKLVIPYDALTAFADPSVKFGLQFHVRPDLDEELDALLSELPSTSSFEEQDKQDSGEASDGENVISLDAFRKS